MIDGAERVGRAVVDAARGAIVDGDDPLGTWFCELRSAPERRERGATYTPPAIIRSMVGWAASATRPMRVVDPGAGSGRYLLAAGTAFPRARLIGVEIDPLAALMCRANLAVRKLGSRAEIHLGDYRSLALPTAAGPTLFIGNPPYVRHHDIDQRWKAWLAANAARHELSASQLAGLHVHFFLATLNHARPGDCGAFITAAEWLDVNYGRLVRDLLAGPLGMERMDILDPRLEPFADAQTTAVITCFRVGNTAPVVHVRKLERLKQLDVLAGGDEIDRGELASAKRWSTFRRARREDADLVELGELCRVHRGQVTGSNAVWVAGAETPALPKRVLLATVTRARELFSTEGALRSASQLRKCVDLPVDLDELSARERRMVDVFLGWARQAGGHESYIAQHRSPWWAIKLRAPAPILATYMARRPPAFVRNLAGARHINIAHGLYPRDPLSGACLDALAAHLSRSVSTDDGRTYAGGLTKFEPKEMERLLVPRPDALAQVAAARCTA
ncbi:MAG TPA: N-6 DNA methylase [Kofleriaceae bacterium]|nr:N-6 DNA methylase [Kofleriaceae bacterium]